MVLLVVVLVALVCLLLLLSLYELLQQPRGCISAAGSRSWIWAHAG